MSPERARLRAAWSVALVAALLSRAASALLLPGPMGYDAWGHVAYVLFLDLYRSVPYADQGWSYFHPPLHYALGWLLAQAGSAEVLVRGLALLGGAASVGTALLAADLARRGLPGEPWLPLLAFVAVAFLPVQVYTSPMPGNEQTATFLGSAALAVFVANTARARAAPALDVATGLLAGLALLTKFSAALVPLAIAATLALQLARGALTARRAAARLAPILGLCLLLPAPYYARNLAEFGNPFELSRGTPLVASVEADQPPGERHWSDFVRLPARLWAEPSWRGEHLHRSVWGTAYLRAWVEDARGLALQRALALAGVAPVALFLFGAARALDRVRRRPDAAADAALLLLAAGTLLAFALFAWRVPIFSALKASYLLQLSLPYGYCVALAVAAPPRRAGRALRAAAWLALLPASALALVAFTPGLAQPLRPENAAMAAARAHFGELAAARATLSAEIRLAEHPPAGLPPNRSWALALREALAAVELQAGAADRALALYTEAGLAPRSASPHLASARAPQRLCRVAAAAALAGSREQARRLLDEALASGPLAEALVNRAALRAAEGDLAGAETELRQALAREPELPAALFDLAWVRERGGDPAEAQRLRERAARAERTAPRGFPYGVGDGFHLNEPRFLLRIGDGGLALYRPPRTRWGPPL